MAGPRSDDDFDVPPWMVAVGKVFGLGEITVRWRVIALKRRLRWLRRELVPPSRGFEHQICPACGAVQDGAIGTCAACGERLGSAFTRTLRTFGLSIPSVVSVSSLLGLAMIAVYGRMILARPGQGIWSWDVPTLLAFGANWAPALEDGQWWRLATAVFLHIGLWHLGFNLVALSQIGPSIEDVFGRARMIFLFMVTGIAASLASAFLGPRACSAGASGALMGLIGVAAGWGHRLGTTHGRNVRDQMLKWGAYTMIYGVALRADHWAHGGGFVAGAALGFVFRPETLAHTKASRTSVALGAVGVVTALATVFCALAPPARSLELAQRMKDTWEAAPSGDGDDEEPGEADMAAWRDACALFRRGKTDEALVRAGLGDAPGQGQLDGRPMLETMCAVFAQMAQRCDRFDKSGDPSDFYEGVTFADEAQRRQATDAARQSCAGLAAPPSER